MVKEVECPLPIPFSPIGDTKVNSSTRAFEIGLRTNVASSGHPFLRALADAADSAYIRGLKAQLIGGERHCVVLNADRKRRLRALRVLVVVRVLHHLQDEVGGLGVQVLRHTMSDLGQHRV